MDEISWHSLSSRLKLLYLLNAEYELGLYTRLFNTSRPYLSGVRLLLEQEKTMIPRPLSTVTKMIPRLRKVMTKAWWAAPCHQMLCCMTPPTGCMMESGSPSDIMDEDSFGRTPSILMVGPS